MGATRRASLGPIGETGGWAILRLSGPSDGRRQTRGTASEVVRGTLVAGVPFSLRPAVVVAMRVDAVRDPCSPVMRTATQPPKTGSEFARSLVDERGYERRVKDGIVTITPPGPKPVATTTTRAASAPRSCIDCSQTSASSELLIPPPDLGGNGADVSDPLKGCGADLGEERRCQPTLGGAVCFSPFSGKGVSEGRCQKARPARPGSRVARPP